MTNRRRAIFTALAAIIAALAPKPAKSQDGSGSVQFGPPVFFQSPMLSLDLTDMADTLLEVRYRGEVIKITRDELMAELRAPKEATR